MEELGGGGRRCVCVCGGGVTREFLSVCPPPLLKLGFRTEADSGVSGSVHKSAETECRNGGASAGRVGTVLGTDGAWKGTVLCLERGARRQGQCSTSTESPFPILFVLGVLKPISNQPAADRTEMLCFRLPQEDSYVSSTSIQRERHKLLELCTNPL